MMFGDDYEEEDHEDMADEGSDDASDEDVESSGTIVPDECELYVVAARPSRLGNAVYRLGVGDYASVFFPPSLTAVTEDFAIPIHRASLRVVHSDPRFRGDDDDDDEKEILYLAPMFTAPTHLPLDFNQSNYLPPCERPLQALEEVVHTLINNAFDTGGVGECVPIVVQARPFEPDFVVGVDRLEPVPERFRFRDVQASPVHTPRYTDLHEASLRNYLEYAFITPARKAFEHSDGAAYERIIARASAFADGHHIEHMLRIAVEETYRGCSRRKTLRMLRSLERELTLE